MFSVLLSRVSQNSFGICVQGMRIQNHLGSCAQSVRSQCLGSLCPGCHISTFGGLAHDMRSPDGLGVDDWDVKALNSLGDSVPGCEVCETFVHLYPRKLIL